MEYNEFKEHVRCIRYDDGHVADHLAVLVDSVFFSRMSVFDVDRWDRLLKFNRDVGIDRKDGWDAAVATVLFLAIKETPEQLLNVDSDDIFGSELYRHIRNQVRNEIEKELFDGRTLYQEINIDEEWPVGDNYDEDGDCTFDFPDDEVDIETEVFDNILLEQARGLVSDMEWEIITAEHGDGPALAEKYETSESNIRNIRQRTIERLRSYFVTND